MEVETGLEGAVGDYVCTFCAGNKLAVITGAGHLSLFTVKCLLATFSSFTSLCCYSCWLMFSSAKGSLLMSSLLSQPINHCLLNQCATINAINATDPE